MTYPDIDNLKIIDLEKVDSTNSYIKRNHDSLRGDYPIAVFATNQIAGRGREDRVWHSNKKNGLFCSIGIEIKNTNNLNFLSLSIGIAISEFLSSLTNEKFQIKWPNDILFKNKKIAGILIENIIFDNKVSSIIGIGININNVLDSFPIELKEKVTSLKIISNNHYNIERIRNNFLNYVFKWLNILENKENKIIIEKFNQLSMELIDKKISFHYNEKMIKGIYKGIGNNGEIIIEDKNKIKTFFSGEIILKNSLI